MNTPKLEKRAIRSAYVAFVVFAASLAAACGDDAESDDPKPIPATGGKAGTGGAGSAGETSAGVGNEPGSGGSGATGTGGAPVEAGGASGSGGEAGGSTEPGTGGQGGSAPESCDPQGDYDCYPCAPETNEQYLNRCSDAECAPFDNAERILDFDGTLPDL